MTWRLCDLHSHTTPNEQSQAPWDAANFVRSRVALGLDVVAITDHDQGDRVAEAIDAAEGTRLIVIAGVELSTDRGHLVVLAPDPDGLQTIPAFLTRIGARPNQQVRIDDVLAAAKSVRLDGAPWSERLVFVGAHVDQDGAMLARAQQLSLSGQLQLASNLHALEVVNDQTRQDWSRSGVKHRTKMTLLRASDSHDPSDSRLLATWLYLPKVSAPSLHHALALRESSVDFSAAAPAPPAYAVESIAFTGGHHDGLRFNFCERANAVIGPPNSGKSLIVDALKYVFGIESGLDDVERISVSRRNKCLPQGSKIEVVVRTPGGSVPLSRAIGARPPTAPFQPIVFSQTELTRRAGEPAPSIGLLDLHVEGAGQLKRDIEEAAGQVAERLQTLFKDAATAASLRSSVGNPVDGLSATSEALRQLAGAEATAKLATAATSTADWRQKVLEEITRWRDEAYLPRPTIPAAPPVDVTVTPGLQNFAPKSQVDTAIAEAMATVDAAVRVAVSKIEAVFAEQEQEFQRTQADVEQQLSEAGFERGSEVEIQLAQLRDRLASLQRESQLLSALDAKVDEGLVTLRALHNEVRSCRDRLTNERRAACGRINASMRAFFSRVQSGSITAHLDSLIDDLKTGTHMRAITRQGLRNSLDRFAVLETAVRRTQGLVTAESTNDLGRLVETALGRGRQADLAQLACLWPGDSLVLAMHGESGTPTPFSELTEGLRALAIKEISFASSDLPVVTDQPEDAVPTRAVYENLVPTLREQRRRRQFIVVSHDANIVVASDVDQITVLQANDDLSPHTGSLFDPRIRASALEHLEGGRQAFRLRADRYAAMGEHAEV